MAIPSVLPPPFPFKIFVLTAGVLGLPFSRFLAAIVLGRSIRYFTEAFFAVRYGESMMAYLRDNAHGVLGGSLLVVGVAGMAVILTKRLRMEPRGDG